PPHDGRIDSCSRALRRRPDGARGAALRDQHLCRGEPARTHAVRACRLPWGRPVSAPAENASVESGGLPPRPPLTPRDRRRNRIIAVTVLVTVWILLWGTVSWANLLSGLVVA